MTASPWPVLAELDVHLIWTDDESVLQGRRARWFPSHATIVMDKRLERRLARCSLAHELGHVILGHPAACGAEFFDNRNEVEADRFAARMLLPDLDEVATELATTSHHGHAATHLRVTRDILNARLADLTDEETRQVKRRVWSIHEGVGA